MNQPLPLVEQLKNLVHLQELDLKIDSLKKDKTSLPAGLKAIDDSLAKLRTTIETKKNQLNEIEKVSRQTQAALDLNQDRLSRSSTKMDAVQNSQEFQAASKEIDQLKKLNITLEEQSKKSKTETDAIRTEVSGLEEKLQKNQQERDAQFKVLSGQVNQVTADIDTLLSQRAQYSAHVESRILAQYDRVRAARNGLGIVPAVAGRCKGCNMIVPPQLYNEIHRGTTLHSCPSCHRILFVPSSAGSSDEGKSGENPAGRAV